MLNLLHFEEWPAVAGSKTGSAFPEISGKNLRGEEQQQSNEQQQQQQQQQQ